MANLSSVRDGEECLDVAFESADHTVVALTRVEFEDCVFDGLRLEQTRFADCTFVAVSYTHLTLPTSDLV